MKHTILLIIGVFLIGCAPKAKKPNIYIYPEKTIDLNVNISFP